jgi:hypothetical protein
VEQAIRLQDCLEIRDVARYFRGRLEDVEDALAVAG